MAWEADYISPSRLTVYPDTYKFYGTVMAIKKQRMVIGYNNYPSFSSNGRQILSAHRWPEGNEMCAVL